MELLDHIAVITGAQRIWSVGAQAGASKWMALRREVPGLARVRSPSATNRLAATDRDGFSTEGPIRSTPGQEPGVFRSEAHDDHVIDQ